MRLLKLFISFYLLLFINNQEYQNVVDIRRIFNGENYNYNDSYIAFLDIPKINLKRGLYAKESPLNSISYNIAFLAESEYPNDNSNTIIIGHSGNSNISYFEDLKYLSVGDSIYLYYDNYKYHFIISDIYTVLKTGYVNIRRDINKKTITLITCYQSDKQLVIIGYEA